MLLLLRKVWCWFKRYWTYILFPVGLVLGMLAMLSRRKAPVQSSELPKVEEDKRKAEEEAKLLAEAADKERAARVAEIKITHQEAVAHLTKEQEQKVEELVADPEMLNAYLLSLGKAIRRQDL